MTITDSLGSAAVAEFGGQREAAVDGAAAGDDLLLFDDLPSALAGHEALVKQLHAGGLKRAPFLAAATAASGSAPSSASSPAPRGARGPPSVPALVDPDRVRVEDAEAVAARVLRRVHRGVGLGDEGGVAHQLVDAEDGDADAAR